jgi:uncharacterized membrane protein YgdD (TMEM256/DUF423 family)
MTWVSRIALFLAGVAGAAGVALSARAAHGGGEGLDLPARFLLLHAPAFLALAALPVEAEGQRLKLVALAGLGLGLALFCGDLVLRASVQHSLFRMAAPLGGLLLIAGWLTLCAMAVLPRKRSR